MILPPDPRKTYIIDRYRQTAEDQGFSPIEARHRAGVWWDFFAALDAGMHSVREGIARAGFTGGEERLYDPALKTSDLAALVRLIRRLPPWRPDAPPPAARSGWTQGPHGLFP